MAVYGGYRLTFGLPDDGVPIVVHKATLTEQHVMENAAHAAGLKGLQQSAYGSIADAATSVRCLLTAPPLSAIHVTLTVSAGPIGAPDLCAIESITAEKRALCRSETQVYIEGLVDDLATQHSDAMLLAVEKTKRGANVLKLSPASITPPSGPHEAAGCFGDVVDTPTEEFYGKLYMGVSYDYGKGSWATLQTCTCHLQKADLEKKDFVAAFGLKVEDIKAIPGVLHCGFYYDPKVMDAPYCLPCQRNCALRLIL